MLSEKPWKLEPVLFLFGGVFLCITVGMMISGWLYPEAAKGAPMTSGPVRLVIFTFHCGALALCIPFVRHHRLKFSEAFGFFNNWKRALLLGCLGAILFLPVAICLQLACAKLLTWLSHPPTEQDAVQALHSVNTFGDQLVMFLLMVLVVPLAEEILFRGILYPFIKRQGYRRTAWWGVSIFFAVIHFNVAIFIPLLVLALVLTWLYERTDNLLAPIATHSLFNALNFGLFYLAKNA